MNLHAHRFNGDPQVSNPSVAPAKPHRKWFREGLRAKRFMTTIPSSFPQRDYHRKSSAYLPWILWPITILFWSMYFRKGASVNAVLLGHLTHWVCIFPEVIGLESPTRCHVAFNSPPRLDVLIRDIMQLPSGERDLPTTVSPELDRDRTFPAFDHALGASGGAIDLLLTSPTLGCDKFKHSKGSNLCLEIVPPVAVIEDLLQVGNCWEFSGSNGHIAIALPHAVKLTHFSMYYPPATELSSNHLRKAPTVVTLWALVPPTYHSTLKQTVSWKKFLVPHTSTKPLTLGQSNFFVEVASVNYMAANDIKQTFTVDLPNDFSTTYVVLQVQDNGGADSTCVHRVAVHGYHLD
ncbi:hypothetical protein BDP27DRAFT_1429708 [Rhodocollybia butyracea]|uniref:SUN domain-containing protein n=1 Tax=Rhodocollybia butyracea TaxID=206335 RepID=A0A9P5PDJ6_9AGAR|nr:hypothetical protein BDP27DRAFT_1429708 [Rhodocollybia butyracea]